MLPNLVQVGAFVHPTAIVLGTSMFVILVGSGVVYGGGDVVRVEGCVIPHLLGNSPLSPELVIPIDAALRGPSERVQGGDGGPNGASDPDPTEGIFKGLLQFIPGDLELRSDFVWLIKPELDPP